MGLFEATVVLYGSPKIISSVNLRLPVSTLFAFDIKSLEELVNASPDFSNQCLNRYFLILFESIDKNILKNLKLNNRIISIYNNELINDYNQQQLNRMKNSFKQITLDLTNDIIRFLTSQGEKQMKLGKIHLVNIYHQQIRILKEWIMAFFKAEPTHILLIPLNSSQQNLDNTQQKLKQICKNLGYDSTIIRQLNDYIPENEKDNLLLPYSKLLFNYEDPKIICKLINKLSSIKLYLYGNELSELNQWSKLMIENENNLMDDEDNWITFIENEIINNDIKWNFPFIFAKQWKMSCVSPFNLNQLNNDPRFQSALRRSHITYYHRQIEITSDIFQWYNHSIQNGYLHIQPQLLYPIEAMKFSRRSKNANELVESCLFQRLFSFDYPNCNSSTVKSFSFIWLDETLFNSDKKFGGIIKSFEWEYFNDLYKCISFIEKQILEQHYIFLIISPIFGEELFLTKSSLVKQIFSIYIYFNNIDSYLIEWTKQYSQIKGIYSDHIKLAQHLKKDYQQLQISLGINYLSNNDQQNKIFDENEDIQCFLPLPITIYNPDEVNLFLSNQKRIDNFLSMINTFESKKEMIEEFRRIYIQNGIVLNEIDNFNYIYESNNGVYWYSRDSFIWRTINQLFRLNNINEMFKFRHILIDIYQNLNESYKENNFNSFNNMLPERYYRGQIMSNKEFNYFNKLKGNIISINTFLSTTKSMQVAIMYAGKYKNNSDKISVIFNIEKDSLINTRPYANISHYSLFKDEEETLFSIGTIFKIENIRQLTNLDHISIIDLKMIDQNNYQFIKTN